MNPRRVWILPPQERDGSKFFQWSTSTTAWVNDSRLVPVQGTLNAGSRGGATFNVLRATKTDPGQKEAKRVPTVYYDGQWVAVCSAPDSSSGQPQFTWTDVEWVGSLDLLEAAIVPGNDPSYTGSISANGIGSVLDSIIPRGWAMYDGTTLTTVQAPQPFNLTGLNGVIIGNRVLGPDSVPAFAALRSQCGVPWSRWDVLSFVVERLLPESCGLMVLNPANASTTTFLQDTGAPESWDLSGKSIGQILDLIVPRSYALGWQVAINASGAWSLNVYPLLGTAEAGVPVATPYANATLTGQPIAAAPTVVYDSTALYDDVRVIGGPIVWCGPLATRHNWIFKGWSATAETAYKAGASTIPNYATMTDAQQAERNAQVRGGSRLSAVFSRFLVGPGTNTGAMLFSSVPTLGTPSTAFFPEVVWDGSTATVNTSTTKDPAWTTAMVERTIPWRRGIAADGTNLGLADDLQSPTYLPPLVFAKVQSQATDEPLWYDLTQEYTRRPGFGVDVDDRAAGIRLTATPAEWLAKGDWTGMEPSTICNYATTAAQVTASGATIVDWRDIVAVVAIAGGQRVEVIKTRDGAPSGLARRSLVLEYPELQSWWVHAGTPVGLKPQTSGSDQTEPDVIAARTHVRNDWPTAERIARMASAYAFSQRATLSVEWAGLDNLPAWAVVGTYLEEVTDNGTPIYLDTPVEEVTYRWQEGRATIRTDLPPAPTWMSRINQAASPVLGGSVATELLDIQRRVERVEAKSQGVAVTPQKPAQPAAEQFVRLKITGGNTLLTFGGNTYKGVKQVTSGTLSALPSAAPNNTTTYADGIGYGKVVDQNLVEITTSPDVWVTNYDTIQPDTGAALTQSFGYHAPNGYPCLCKRYIIGGIPVYKIVR